MIFPDVTTEEWVTKYPALSVIKRKCHFCKKPLITSIPFIEKNWIGLMSEDCSCGKGKAISISIVNPKPDFSNAFKRWFDEM